MHQHGILITKIPVDGFHFQAPDRFLTVDNSPNRALVPTKQGSKYNYVNPSKDIRGMVS